MDAVRWAPVAISIGAMADVPDGCPPLEETLSTLPAAVPLLLAPAAFTDANDAECLIKISNSTSGSCFSSVNDACSFTSSK